MNKPQIRFKGFEDEWKQSSFGALLNYIQPQSYIVKSSKYKTRGIPVLTAGKSLLLGYTDERFGVFNNLPCILFDDFTTDSKFIDYPFKVKSSAAKMLVPFAKDANIYLLYLIMQNTSFEHSSHRRYWINEYSNIPIFLPSNAEQKQLTSIFAALDEMIAEAEREVNRLEKMKQASLQKMFPRPGASIPEIRFNGFVKDWSVTNLGSIGSTYNGLSGKTKEDFGHGEARFVTYMNVFSNPIANPFQVEAVEIDESQNAVKYGDILFTTSSETPEEVGMSSVWQHNAAHVYLNSFCFGFRPTQTVHLNYIAYFLRSPFFRNNMVILAQGISRFNISKHKAMELPVLLPEISEQKAIGEFFRNLDALLSSKHQKLTKLRNIKKACLDKMFVNTSEL